MNQRPVRRSKRKETELQDAESFVDNWASVIDGIVELDPNEVHSRLERELKIKGLMSGSHLLSALASVNSNYVEACRLKNRARREYELYKVEWDTWLEEKKTAARQALEEEKAQKKFKKQIDIAMVNDQVRVTWPQDYRSRYSRCKDFQAAVHTLEDLAEAWKSQSRTLAAMKDLVLGMGAASGNTFEELFANLKGKNDG